MKFLLKLFSVCVFFVLLIVIAAISLKPITLTNQTLTPIQVAAAKHSLQRLLTELKKESDHINIVLYQTELDALSDLAAHTINNANFENYISAQTYTTAVSYNLSQLFKIQQQDFYINAYCSMSQQDSKFSVEHCKLGSIPIPQFIAEPLLFGALKHYLPNDSAQLAQHLFEQFSIQPNALALSASRPPLLITKVRESFNSIKQQATDFAVGSKFNTDKFYEYISVLENNKNNSNQLAYFIGLLFEKARSNMIAQPSLSAVRENRHALWALATYFGNRRFAKIAGLSMPSTIKPNQTPVLRTRQDLSLHFLYSAILEQLGGKQIGLNIGEIKELYDANEGGSGYSFADLAADKAGLSFSQFVVYSEQKARQAQQMLAGIKEEAVFFPQINKLPEGLSATQFQQELGNKHSAQYKVLERIIDNRITELPLYQ